MSLLYNFMFKLLFSTILFIEISNGSTALPSAHHNIDGIEFDIALNEELIIAVKFGYKQPYIDYCPIVNPATNECVPDEMQVLAFVGGTFDEMILNTKWINKMNMIVLNPVKPINYVFDVLTFGFPCYSSYFENMTHFKVGIFVGDAVAGNEMTGFSAYFEDTDDNCKDYRPIEITPTNMFNVNIFFNRKWTKYAYYFIKKDKYICAYTFKYEHIFEGEAFPEFKYTFPVNFSLIDNYPTENYAPNFFCIDALYGTFVSLYWDQQHPKNLPEAHYYIINEKDIKKTELIDRIVLKDFDQEVLKDIFNNNFDSKYFPTFSSCGRQIFIWFKRPSENRIFNGIWKNETTYNTHFQDVVRSHSYHNESLRKLFYAKKDWIQYDRPIGRFDAVSLPPPITIPSTNYKPPTAPKPTTSTTSTPLTLKPTATNNKSNSSYHQSALFSNQQFPKCSDTIYNNLWFLILLICIIIIEAIILVILIIFKYRGAKKMKNAMAKESMHSTKQKPAPVETKIISKKIELPKKKKSVKEKSMTTTSDHGGKTADDKKTTTVDQTINYYTVNENFGKS